MIAKSKQLVGKIVPRIGAHVVFGLSTVASFYIGHGLTTYAILLFQWITDSTPEAP